MTRLTAALAIIAAMALAPAPAPAQTNLVLNLWPGGAPGALGKADQDIPTLTVYRPESTATSITAVVVCPGGGYGGLASHEGHDYALWLNQNGLVALVLKYRLGSHGYRHPVMLNDVTRAIRVARARVREWNLTHIGVMGSSAGGHLVSTALTHFDKATLDPQDAIDRESSRPDFGILCYPVISMTGPYAHQGSRINLLGRDAPQDLARQLSNELQVTERTPPCFIWHTLEDTGVVVEHSLQFAAALRRAKVPFDLHVYQKGKHGIGLADKPPFAHAHPWAADCLFWLRQNGWR